MSDTPGQLVTRFVQAWERRDLEAALALVSDDIEYENVPMGVVRGMEQMRAALTPFFASCSEIEWPVHVQVEQGDVVVNERTDRFHIGGRWVEIRVMGLFRVADGRITTWRDYFDLHQFQSQMEAATADSAAS
jgi:limonene-1,2-epoxide hydrolase